MMLKNPLSHSTFGIKFMEKIERSTAESINSKAISYHHNIVNYLNSHELQNLCYARKSRVKSKEDILEKYDRKRCEPEKKHYRIEDISDVIGLRFIVLFKQDVIPVIKSIIALLSKDCNQQNPFHKCSIEELIYYKGNISLSNISHKIRDSFSSIGMDIKERNSREGYSSIHIVCNLDTEHSDVLPENYKIPVEIQVRTIFEDAWGEIDHKYGYKARRDNSSFHPTLDKHLQTLKQFVDACVDYADLIVEESEIELNPTDFSKVLNIPENSTSLSVLFGKLNIEEKYLNEYSDAIQAKNKAIEEGNSKELIKCADYFLSIKNDYLKHKADLENDVFSFYCSLNYAFCNLVNNTEKGVKNAKDMYLVLKEIDPNNSLILMRLGQTMGRIGEFDDSISLLKESYTSATNPKSKFEVKESDIKYILSKVPKTVGYYIWLKIYNSGQTLEKEYIKSLYREAYDFTLKGFKALNKSNRSEEYIDYQNNLVFYLTEINKIQHTEETRNLIEERLVEIEKGYESLEDIDATILHTLLNSHYMLENIDKCKKYSNLLKTKIFRKLYDFDDSEALDMLKLVDDVNSLVTKG